MKHTNLLHWAFKKKHWKYSTAPATARLVSAATRKSLVALWNMLQTTLFQLAAICLNHHFQLRSPLTSTNASSELWMPHIWPFVVILAFPAAYIILQFFGCLAVHEDSIFTKEAKNDCEQNNLAFKDDNQIVTMQSLHRIDCWSARLVTQRLPGWVREEKRSSIRYLSP